MPPSECIMKTQRRGPVLNIVISVLRSKDDYSETKTGSININDLAFVTGTIKSLKNDSSIELVVGSKKSEAAKNLTVSISISSRGAVKTFICQDEWADIPITRVTTCHSDPTNYYRTYLYSVEVDITINVTMPAAHTSSQLYEDTEFTDFKLQAIDGVVEFHKSVLFIQSDMFRTMLRGQWKETAEGSISMNESMQTLQHLKDFMYLGTIPDEGLEQLLLMARRCLMDNLAAACVDKLIATVTPETYDALADFACQNNIVELVKAFARVPNHVVNGIRWYQ